MKHENRMEGDENVWFSVNVMGDEHLGDNNVYSNKVLRM